MTKHHQLHPTNADLGHVREGAESSVDGPDSVACVGRPAAQLCAALLQQGRLDADIGPPPRGGRNGCEHHLSGVLGDTDRLLARVVK